MKKVEIKLKNLEVIDHLLKEDIVKIKMEYSCKDKKEIIGINLKIEPKVVMAEKVLKLIREHEREKNYIPKWDVIEDILIINILDYEDVSESLEHFFGKLCDTVKNVKKTRFADGYLNTLNAVKGMKLSL